MEKFKHNEKKFHKAIGVKDKELNKLADEAVTIIHMIERRNEKRSILLEQIMEKIKKRTKEEISIILLMAIEVTQDQKYNFIGELLGDIIAQITAKAGREGLSIDFPCPMQKNENDDEFEDFFETESIKKEIKKDDRIDYVA